MRERMFHYAVDPGGEEGKKKKLPEVTPTDTAVADDEVFFNREVQNAKDAMFYHYGKLPDDHPITREVRTLMEEALGDTAKGLSVVILPEWHQVNAIAFPDGTIVIAARLLKFVTYRQELQAILAHEAMHIKKEHGERRREQWKRVQDAVETMKRGESGRTVDETFRFVGLQRLHEYEADIRGAMQELDRHGVNPLGLKLFLERLDVYEKEWLGGSERGLTHGTLADRALNLESIFYFYDLSALAKDLGELPQTLKKEVKARPPCFDRARFRLGPDSWEKGEERKGIQEKRKQIARELSQEHLPRAINDTRKLLRNKKEPMDTRRVNRAIMEILTTRCERELFDRVAWESERDRGMARTLFYELSCGLPYVSAKKLRYGHAFSFAHEKDCASLSSRDDYEELLRMMGRLEFVSLLSEHGTPFAVLDFSSRIFSRIVTNEHIDTAPTEASLTSFIDFATRWSSGIENLSRLRGVAPIKAASVFRETVAVLRPFFNIFPQTLIERTREQCIATGYIDAKSFEQLQHETNKTKERTEGKTIVPPPIMRSSMEQYPPEEKERVRSLATDIIKKLSVIREIDKIVTVDIVEAFRQQCEGKSLQYVLDMSTQLTDEVFTLLELLLQRDDENPFDERRVRMDDDIEDEDEVDELYREDRILHVERMKKTLVGLFATFKIFRDTITAHPSFVAMSENEKRTFIFREFMGFLGQIELMYSSQLAVNEKGAKIVYDPQHYYDEIHLSSLLGHEEWEAIEGIGDFEPWLTRQYSEEELIEFSRQFLHARFQGESLQFADHDTSRKCFARLLIAHFGRLKSWEEIFAAIEHFESQDVPVRELFRQYTDLLGAVLSVFWKTFPKEVTQDIFSQLRTVATFIRDPFLRLHVQAYAYEQLWPRASFQEKIELFFGQRVEGAFDLRRFSTFIEEEVETEEEFHAVRKRLDHEADLLSREGSREAGIGAILSNMRPDPDDALALTSALLETWKSDERLKSCIYENIRNSRALGGDTSDDMEEIVAEETRANLVLADDVVRLLFATDTSAKYLLLRKILTGDKGLLSKDEYRVRFLEMLFTQAVGKSDDQLSSIIHETIRALGRTKQWQPVYFALQPILLERLAIPPKRLSLWGDIPEVREDCENAGSALATVTKPLTFEKIGPEVRAMPWRYGSEFIQYSENRLRAVLRQKGILTNPKSLEHLSPLSFIVQFVQHTGALGVRFLQLLPQFAHLPEEYRNEFSAVYDKVFGQSKFTAVLVLEREWPDFWKAIRRVKHRAGGGSLMTVYEVETAEGNREVVKVRNPNLKYHLDDRRGLVKEVLGHLAREHGERYRLSGLVVDDVVAWVRRDVDFQNFLEEDKKFRTQNDGFQPEEFSYAMYVPQSKGPENPYFMREEYIEGKNLTQWDTLVAEGHDMKQVVGIIVRNYLAQLAGGFLHSDVHVGNFRITKEKKVAILDRNFFLTLSADEKALVYAIMTPGTAADVLLDKFLATIAVKPADDRRARLLASLRDALSQVQRGEWEKMTQFFVTLRETGVQLPLEITLIFKNIGSLHQMARRAGFANIVDALCYQPA